MGPLRSLPDRCLFMVRNESVVKLGEGTDYSKSGNTQATQITESIVVVIWITGRIVISSFGNNQHHALSCSSHQHTIGIFQIGLPFMLANFLPTRAFELVMRPNTAVMLTWSRFSEHPS